ncbi:MAG: prepilin peptidase [Pseudomonadota bacterium]
MLAISTATALWFLPFAVPVCIWVAWSDLSSMKIPNKAVVALLAVFVVIGIVALPLTEYLWRYAHFVVILIFGFVLAQAGIGAGDAKFAAAMAPFIDRTDAISLLSLFAAVLLAAFATHRIFRAIPAIRRAFPDWKSWTHKKFPMGFALGGTLILYLIAGVALGS